ncbi:unnamed protein product [Adineta steineri]|uniref:Uncharacterized protein n=1 Tax=Adineta steineri TaxID=433720 RepID=A0A814MZM2_9BILA|nr:unnamed protein product [Adineta steineri]CAF1621133.1 unnamed protein product [Adineta steineri]
MPSNVDIENEGSIICRIVNNTSIEENQDVIKDEIDNKIYNQVNYISEDKYPIDLRITSKKISDPIEIPITSEVFKSSINILRSNELNNQQPVSCDRPTSNIISLNHINLPEMQKFNSKCLNSIVYNEESQRYYCPKRCRRPLRIISPIPISNESVKKSIRKFQSRHNYRRRQKRALQKGKHVNNCKYSSTTDLSK